MKRRSFLKILAGTVAAVASGVALALPEVTRPEVDLRPPPIQQDINPAWLNAKYEVGFLFSADAYKRLAPTVDPCDRDALRQHLENMRSFARA